MIKFEETTIYFENGTQNYKIDFAKLIVASPTKFCKIFKGVLISIMNILSPETLQEFKLFALGIYEKITEGMNKKAILSQTKRVKFCQDAYNAFLNWDWLTEKYPDCVSEKGHIKEERLIRLLAYFRDVVRTNNYDGNFYISAGYAMIKVKSDYNPYNYDHFDIEDIENLKKSIIPEKSYSISKKQLRDILTMENKSFRIKNPRLAGDVKIDGLCFDIDTVKKCCKESKNDSVVITTNKGGGSINFDFGDFKLLIACKTCKNPSIYESILEIKPFCNEVKPEEIQEETNTTETSTEINTVQVKAKEYNSPEKYVSSVIYIADKPIRHKTALYEKILKSFNRRQKLPDFSTAICSGGNCIGKIPKPKIKRFLQYMSKSENPLRFEKIERDSFNGLSPPYVVKSA